MKKETQKTFEQMVVEDLMDLRKEIDELKSMLNAKKPTEPKMWGEQ